MGKIIKKVNFIIVKKVTLKKTEIHRKNRRRKPG